jgi:hypothetical protein
VILKVPLTLPSPLRIALETRAVESGAFASVPVATPLTLTTVGGAATAACGARTPMPASAMIPSGARRRVCMLIQLQSSL